MSVTGVAVLGATGSIGRSAAQVLERFPERFRVTGLVARSNTAELVRQAEQFRAGITITTDPEKFRELRGALSPSLPCAAGWDPVLELVTAPETDIVLCAIVGTGGLEPVLAALRAGKRVALASKEVLVLAGEVVERTLDASPQAELIPVDSEHSAIFQCLCGRKRTELKTIYLTASGGAFRDWPRERLASATPEDALAHPTWNMGPKVTIDSASLMNKALEMIEARHLFRARPEQIEVLIHPQSIVHSMVELTDSGCIAQLSRPDMRFAIQYALTFPDRVDGGLPELDFRKLLHLDLRLPEPGRYPALDFARAAMRAGGTLPGVLNAANEVAVERFRKGEIRFPSIWEIVGRTMEHHRVEPQQELETIRAADAWARQFAAELQVP